MYKFKKAFRVVNGKIIDADQKEVRLWGVNYYMPFNHNYVNIEEMGIDHFNAIDRDIEDFKRMRIDLVRMHVYDREISDIYGNIIENDHLRVMDYLVEQLDKAGIYIMMTPMVWYNTVVNQQSVTDGYAYWNVGMCKTFGFSNYFTAHEMIWNEKALVCQENYLDQFFSRKNIFSNKKLCEYDNVVVIEAMNEPIYPNANTIKMIRMEKVKTDNPFKKEESGIVDMYDEYLNKNNLVDIEENANDFCVKLID